MADKAIGELTAAASVNPADLFVLEQNNTAKKLTGQTLENWLLSFADGHGGIQSIVKKSTVGLTDTYRITMADTTVFDFTVENGNGIASVAKQSTAGLTDTYRITYTNGSTSTFTVTNGAKGDKGDMTYVWIRYASQEPTAESHDFGTLPDDWMGVYVGEEAAAPADYREYQWFKIKGDTGDNSRVTGYEIGYQAAEDGANVPEGEWLPQPPARNPGGYIWTKVTTLYNNGTAVDSYSVAYQGQDGRGAVETVNGIAPENGDVQLTPGSLLNLVYPVGSIYLSMVDTSPASVFGGSWAQIRDVFLLGAGDTYKVTANEKDGGASTVTLGTNQIPSHNHGSGASGYSFMRADSIATASVTIGSSTAKYIYTNDNHHISTTSVTANAGGGQSHENMPPYKTVYMWQRIA